MDKHIGSSFDDFWEEEGILAETEAKECAPTHLLPLGWDPNSYNLLFWNYMLNISLLIIG